MERPRNYGDWRQASICAYCAGATDTKDHVPSKVLLDEPYPVNLPTVRACPKCNEGFSIDEEYLACLIDCVVSGSTNQGDVSRAKVREALINNPSLSSRIGSSSQVVDGVKTFLPEEARVRNVILKLARGHALYELNEHRHDEPTAVSFFPITSMSEESRRQFEQPIAASVWPEVGSRAMQRLASSAGGFSQWLVVQPDRYRFMAYAADGVTVRMVLSEYLACEVYWQDREQAGRWLPGSNSSVPA